MSDVAFRPCAGRPWQNRPAAAVLGVLAGLGLLAPGKPRARTGPAAALPALGLRWACLKSEALAGPGGRRLALLLPLALVLPAGLMLAGILSWWSR